MFFPIFVRFAAIAIVLQLFAAIVNAGPSRECSVAEDSAYFEFAGSAFWNHPYYCDAVGDYAFVTMDFGLMILDVSDKSNPQVASRMYMPSSTRRLQVVGDYAYVCGGGDLSTRTDWATFTIVDISNPFDPSVVSCYQSEDSVEVAGIKIDGYYAYLAGGSRLYIVSLSSISNPVEISSVRDVFARDLEFVNDTVSVVGPHRIFSVDVSNPYFPDPIVSSIHTWTGWTNGIEVGNDLVYLANGDSGLTIMDLYHGEPYVLSNFPLDIGSINCKSQDLILVDDTIVYIGGQYVNSVKVLNVADPYAVDSIGKCGPWGTKAVGLDLDNDYLYAARPGTGLCIMNATDHTSPSHVSLFHESNDEPKAIEVRGNIGYLMFKDTIRIVDLSDPANITQIGWAEVGVNNCLEIVGNLMLVGNSTGMTAFDISDPANPVYLDALWTDYEYVHSVDARGDYAYITMWRYGYGIVDISDPSNLVMVGTLTNDYWPSANTEGEVGMTFVGDYALTGFYSEESLEEGFLVIDISDPANPQGVAEHVLTNQVACMEVIDTLLYFAHWGTDTLFAWDISDVLNPIPVASWRPAGFDIFHSEEISHAGKYLVVRERYSRDVLAVDPSDWSGHCTDDEDARFPNHGNGTDIATSSNNIYITSLSGLTALTLKLDGVCGDINGDGGFDPDIADLIYLVSYMFQDGPEPPDLATCDFDGNGTPEPDIADLIYLVSFMFQDGPALQCP